MHRSTFAPLSRRPARHPQRPGVDQFIEWDVRNWSVALRLWERDTSQDLSRCRALEVGSRHGGLSLWLALRGARVVCSDVQERSPEAYRRHVAAGVEHLVRYERLDASSIPYRNHFDIIVFKSVLGNIGGRYGRVGQTRAVGQMHKALKPGGELFFAENLVASPLHQYCRERFIRWGRRWCYVSVRDMLALLAPFAGVTFRTAGFAGAFGRTPRQRRLLGAADRLGLDRLVPQDWRYIIAGIARKRSEDRWRSSATLAEPRLEMMPARSHQDSRIQEDP